MIIQILRYLRPWFWIPALASMWAGHMRVGGGRFVLSLWLLPALVVGPGLSGFAESINDIFDLSFDRLSCPKAVLGLPLAGGSGALSLGKLPIRTCWIVVVLAAFLSLASATLLSTLVVGLAGLGLILGYIYSAPPIRLKSRGILGLFPQAVGYGPIAYYIGYCSASRGSVDLSATLLQSVLIGVWVGVVGLTADLLDLEGDFSAGVHNLAVRIGKRRTILVIVVGAWSIFLAAAVRMWTSPANLRMIAGSAILLLGYSVCLARCWTQRVPPWIHLWTLAMEGLFPLFAHQGL